MKKSFLLLAVLLISGLCANAVNWQPVSANGVDMYVDTDSFRNINDDESLYAVKYSVGNGPEKVAYLKSNFKKDYMGVIFASDYDAEKYRPNGVFAVPRVFMKPVKEDSFLSFAHKYASAMSGGQEYKTAFSPNEYPANYLYGETPVLRDDLQVAYNQAKGVQLTPAQLQDYLVRTCKIIESNWTPPSSGKGSRAIVLLSIGADGSLLNYDFKEASGDEMTDRSILSAVEKSVPYPKFPSIAKNAYALDFQYVFEHDTFKKSVVY